MMHEEPFILPHRKIVSCNLLSDLPNFLIPQKPGFPWPHQFSHNPIDLFQIQETTENQVIPEISSDAQIVTKVLNADDTEDVEDAKDDLKSQELCKESAQDDKCDERDDCAERETKEKIQELREEELHDATVDVAKSQIKTDDVLDKLFCQDSENEISNFGTVNEIEEDEDNGINLSSKTVVELRHLCKLHNLSTKGVKNDLIQRLSFLIVKQDLQTF